MRFTDLMLSLPPLLLAMALVAVLGPSLRTIFIVIGLVSWTSIARVVRAERWRCPRATSSSAPERWAHPRAA